MPTLKLDPIQGVQSGAKFKGPGAPPPGSNGPFASSTFQAPTPVTAAPSTPTVPGPYDAFRQPLYDANPGIPRSFVDGWVDDYNKQAQLSPTPAGGLQSPSVTPQALQTFSGMVQRAWAAEPNKATYTQADQKRIASTNSGAVGAAAGSAVAGAAQGETNSINDFYTQHVTPALTGAAQGVANQGTVDRGAENVVDTSTADYKSKLAQLTAQRNAAIEATNSTDTGLGQQFHQATVDTNAKIDPLVQQYIPIANNANTLNSGLAQQLQSAASSTNANQTGLFNTLSGQAAGINANQTGLFNTLSGQAAGLNSQQDAALSTVLGQFSQLNAQDQAQYMKYLQETDPLMAQKIAQASNPAYVANQEDVVQRYKELSTPQVTAQERLIAELARQKTESDERSSREAVLQQLGARGLSSGGLVLTNTRQAQEQAGRERLNAELGLQANAVSRSMEGLSGYSSASNALRNADDNMKHFQDVYAQNEATRVGNLAGQREAFGLQTTQQQGQRDQYGYADTSDTLAQNWNRDQGVFDAGTTTNNNNFSRDQSVFDAGTTTNNNNFNRTDRAVTTGIGVNDTNAARSRGAVTDTIGGYMTELGNTGLDLGNQRNINDTNFTRTSGGLDAAGQAAGADLTATTAAQTFKTGNASSEASTKTGLAGTASGAGTQFAGTAQTVSNDQVKAILLAAGLSDADIAKLYAEGKLN